MRRRLLRLVDIADLLGVSKQRADQQLLQHLMDVDTPNRDRLQLLG
jgi:hypothetical protein